MEMICPHFFDKVIKFTAIIIQNKHLFEIGATAFGEKQNEKLFDFGFRQLQHRRLIKAIKTRKITKLHQSKNKKTQ